MTSSVIVQLTNPQQIKQMESEPYHSLLSRRLLSLIACDLISTDLISSELSGSECAVKRPSSPRLRPIKTKCASRCRATANRVGSHHTHCHPVQTKWGHLRCSQMKRDEMSETNAPLYVQLSTVGQLFTSVIDRIRSDAIKKDA